MSACHVVLEKRQLNECCCIITEVPRDTAIQWCLKNSFELVELSSRAVDSDGSDEGFSSWSSLLCQTITFTFCVLMMHHWLSIATCMWLGHACTVYGFIVHFDLLSYSTEVECVSKLLTDKFMKCRNAKPEQALSVSRPDVVATKPGFSYLVYFAL